MTTAAKIEFKAAAQFNPVFRPVNEWRGRYRILKGSAGSGKSVNIAQDYIAKLSDPAYTGANLLVVRKIEETNRDSTFAELQAAIYRMFGPYADRFWKVNLNPLALECKITGNRIIFAVSRISDSVKGEVDHLQERETGLDMVRRSDGTSFRRRRHSGRPSSW